LPDPYPSNCQEDWSESPYTFGSYSYDYTVKGFVKSCIDTMLEKESDQQLPYSPWCVLRLIFSDMQKILLGRKNFAEVPML
jgi:hypothetical protein